MIGTKFNKPLQNVDLSAYSEAAEWCNQNGAMIVDQGDYYEVCEIPAPSLDECKERKIAELKGISNQKEIAPLDGFDVDEKSITRLQIAQKVLDGSEQTIDWTMADNSVKAIDSADIAQVFADLAERSNNLHAKYRELKDLVNAAETVVEIEAVEWGD